MSDNPSHAAAADSAVRQFFDHPAVQTLFGFGVASFCGVMGAFVWLTNFHDVASLTEGGIYRDEWSDNLFRGPGLLLVSAWATQFVYILPLIGVARLTNRKRFEIGVSLSAASVMVWSIPLLMIWAYAVWF